MRLAAIAFACLFAWPVMAADLGCAMLERFLPTMEEAQAGDVDILTGLDAELFRAHWNFTHPAVVFPASSVVIWHGDGASEVVFAIGTFVCRRPEPITREEANRLLRAVGQSKERQ